MELMFSPNSEYHENTLRPCRKWHWQNPSFRKMEVRKARQIAAENAAWWRKEHEKWRLLWLVFRLTRKSLVNEEYKRWPDFHERAERFQTQAWKHAVNWENVYRQGQLYARDSVRTFDPKYGEVV